MPPFHSNESLLLFEASALAPETFVVVAFRGEEAISRPFRFEIDLFAEDPDIVAADVVGEKATFTMLGREVHGVVSEFEYLGYTAENHGYRAVLVPRLWLLSLRLDSQIFFAMTPPDLIRTVLEEGDLAGADMKFDLNESYVEREFYTQYIETDLAFASRIAEHYGISFRFEHADGRDVVVFFDDSSAAPPIGDEKTLRFEPDASLTEPTPNAVTFTERERLVPGHVLVKDYNYRTPETALLSESSIHPDTPGLYYEYGTHHKDQSEGDRLARVRNEEFEAGRRVFRGTSNRSEVQPGFALSLENHFRARMNTDYLVTEVRSKGDHRYSLGWADVQDSPVYENEFVCIPASVPFRPPRATPVPKVPGIMTARLETAGGEYAHLDEEGRYKAKMHFDLSDRSGGEATRPLRMNQPYSGPGYGIHFPNHADTEVVWACVNGDPDRPLALGTAPNPSNASPVSAGNKAHNTIRTWGQNELTMDDSSGNENIYLHATKNHTVDVVDSESITIGANRTIMVGGSHTETIGGSMTLDVGASSAETIGASKTLTIGTVYSIAVAAAMDEAVGGAKTEEVGGIKSETVGAAKAETIGGNRALTVGANASTSVGGNASETVGGNLTHTVGGKFGAEVAKEFAITAKKIQLTAQDEITLKTGSAEISMKKNGDITIKGKKIQIKGSGDVVIKGSKIAAN